MSIKCEVPQGSTLRPLLFLLYINDLNSVFNKAITIHSADDTHLSYASKKLSRTESVMNYELKKLAEWLRSNKLSFNSGKSKLVIFHSKLTKELDEITKKINKPKLSPVPNVHYLDVWEAHVNNLCKKLTQSNGILSKLRHYIPRKTCISVYFSLFYPFIIYGSLAWQLTSKTNLNRVKVILCLKILSYLNFMMFWNPWS